MGIELNSTEILLNARRTHQTRADVSVHFKYVIVVDCVMHVTVRVWLHVYFVPVYGRVERDMWERCRFPSSNINSLSHMMSFFLQYSPFHVSRLEGTTLRENIISPHNYRLNLCTLHVILAEICSLLLNLFNDTTTSCKNDSSRSKTCSFGKMNPIKIKVYVQKLMHGPIRMQLDRHNLRKIIKPATRSQYDGNQWASWK